MPDSTPESECVNDGHRRTITVHPTAQQVGIDAVGHRYRGHRHARLRAGRYCTSLELIAVCATPPARTGLLIGDSVHESTKS